MEQIIWTVRALRAPDLARACPRCGASLYENSGKFRVNANGSKLDAWLIYRCVHCSHTWNLTVFERQNARAVLRSLYDRLLDNDETLALQYGVDPVFLARNGTRPDRKTLVFSVEGAQPQHPCELILRPEMPMDVPLAWALARGLCISQSALRRLFDVGALQINVDARKAALVIERSVWVRRDFFTGDER